MLYTKKGDSGKTRIFSCDQKISKSSAITEALGALDEINSYLGVIKSNLFLKSYKLQARKLPEVIHNIQEDLFIIQAQIAGADKNLDASKIFEAEKIIDEIEKKLPPIKSFLISGSTEISALFDFARTIARRAERRVVAVSEEGKTKVSKETLEYLNRLSSLLYAFARYFSEEAGIKEEAPKY